MPARMTLWNVNTSHNKITFLHNYNLKLHQIITRYCIILYCNMQHSNNRNHPGLWPLCCSLGKNCKKFFAFHYLKTFGEKNVKNFSNLWWSGFLREKTMDDKLIYIPNGDFQDFPFSAKYYWLNFWTIIIWEKIVKIQ